MSQGYHDSESNPGVNKGVIIGGLVVVVLISLAAFYFVGGGSEMIQDEEADFRLTYSESAELLSVEQTGGDTLEPDRISVYINGDEREIQTITGVGTARLETSYEVSVDEAESGVQVEILYDDEVVLYDDTFTYTGNDLQA